jgi:hypothetical protein
LADDSDTKDDIFDNYRALLAESAVLTTFSTILFGFLLNVSINMPQDFGLFNQALMLAALFSMTVAVSLFIMPVIYHHLQYPYRDFEKFKREHRFIVFGIIPSLVSLYLSLEIALSSIMGNEIAFVLASVPFLMIYGFFKMRK